MPDHFPDATPIDIHHVLPRYNRTQMIRLAAEWAHQSRQTHLTTKPDLERQLRRLLRRWEEVGLMPHPSKESGPAAETWSYTNMIGWLELLLNHYANQVEDTKTLACFPIFAWLFWGDGADVPLTQVKRAMKTYFLKGAVSPREAKRLAQELIRRHGARVQRLRQVRYQTAQLAPALELGPEYVQPKGVKHMFADTKMTSSEEMDIAYLAQIMKVILEPQSKRANHGVDSGDPMTWSPSPSAVSRNVIAHRTGLRSIETAPDVIWEWARAFMNLQRVYRQKCDQRASNTEPVPDDDSNVRRQLLGAPDSLLFALGHGMLLAQESSIAETLPAILQPARWLSGEMTADIRGSMRSDRLFPDGRQPMSLAVSVCCGTAREIALQKQQDSPSLSPELLRAIPDNPKEFIACFLASGEYVIGND